jgi:protein disulfide-isomerase A1
MDIKLIAVLIKALGVVLSTDNHWGIQEDKEVVILTKDTFDNFTKNYKYVFIKFFAPWCHHCQEMAPEYTELARSMKVQENGIPVAKIDATEEIELAELHQIQGYPTFKLFFDGNYIDYTGQHNANDMKNWIMKKIGSKIIPITSMDQIKQIENENLALLLLTKPNMGYQLKNYEAAAKMHDDLPFYYSDSNDLSKYFEMEGYFSLIMFRNFNDGRKLITSKNVLSEEVIKQFIDSNSLPWVSQLNEKLLKVIFEEEKTALILFAKYNKNEDLLKIYEEIAVKYQNDVIFSVADPASDLGNKMKNYLEVPEGIINPAILLVFEQKNLLKFKLDNTTKDSLSKFMVDFKAANLIPYFKSEDPPVSNSGLVKVAVGKTFDEIVVNSYQNVLVIGYSNWSQPSLHLLTDVERLAQALIDKKDLLFVKINADLNEHPMLGNNDYPDVRFFKADQKKRPIEITMDKSINGIVNFLELQLNLKLSIGEKFEDEIRVGTGDDL